MFEAISKIWSTFFTIATVVERTANTIDTGVQIVEEQAIMLRDENRITNSARRAELALAIEQL